MSSGDAAVPGGSQQVDLLADIPAAIVAYLQSLEQVGIVIAPARGEIECDLAEQRVKIGHLSLEDSDVIITPRAGVTLRQLGMLIDQAEVALVCGHDPTFGWREVDDVGWSVAIFQPMEA